MATSKKSLLDAAKKNKKDEFYTQLTDIEKELRHYKEHFQNKTVLCNCDDPRVSNFFKYFVLNFKRLGLKKLIATCYKNQDADLFSMQECEQAVHMILTEEKLDKLIEKNGGYLTVDCFPEIEALPLKGDGDFRSPECVELLKEADIVCTNPPFSLFREYVAQLIQYEKRFLIIGNMNAITYKEIFPLFKNNKMWFGCSIHSGDREFGVPDSYPLTAAGFRVDSEGRKFIRVKGVRWFTNLDFKQRHEEFPLYKKYTPADYPKYDNFDAIDVSITKEIPGNYEGVMGVPITFMDKYCPEQFEIVGITKPWQDGVTKIYPQQVQVDKNGKRSNVSKLNDGPALLFDKPPAKKTYYIVDDKIYVQQYARILIKHKRGQHED